MMGRKPKYDNPQQTIDAFFSAVSESFNSPAEGEQGRDGHKKQELLSEEFGISRIKVRKILITTGDIIYSETAQIQALLASGMKLDAVSAQLKTAPSTINSLLPYTKGIYKLSEVSAAAERTAIYRTRKAAVEELFADPSSFNLWNCVCLFAGYPFVTTGRGGKGGAKFKYTVPSSEERRGGGRKYDGEDVEGFGNEIFIINSKGEKREKSITRSSVDYAFSIVQEKGGEITGPKHLKIYGASYVYSLFVRFGLIRPEDED